MPEPTPPRDRTSAERQADHDGLARLSESLVPALVQKLNASALGELEIREGEWRIRLRRHHATAQRRDRSRIAASGGGRQQAPTSTPAAAGSDVRDDADRAVATSPAVGVFRSIATVGTPVRSGDRIAVVDLLGIAQDVVAPADGIVVEIYAQTGEAVEYGEELALIEVASGHGPDDTGRHERDGARNGDA